MISQALTRESPAYRRWSFPRVNVMLEKPQQRVRVSRDSEWASGWGRGGTNLKLMFPKACSIAKATQAACPATGLQEGRPPFFSFVPLLEPKSFIQARFSHETKR